MKTIAVASGKGGTGKTTVATAMSLTLAAAGYKTALLDADVEAPNSHLFLKPRLKKLQDVKIPVPEVDEEKCDGCGECRKVCRFNAVTVINKIPLVFAELCHGCGGCALACPNKAIVETGRTVGRLERDESLKVDFIRGVLDVGQAMAVPVIRDLRHWADDLDCDWVIIDAPPGTSCPVIEASKGVDYLIMVTEPTPFGLNDLELAAQMAGEIGVPHSVIINRADMGDSEVKSFCRRNNIDILLEIPFDRKVAENYARGGLITDVDSGLSKKLIDAVDRIESLIENGVEE